ncbi:YggS family pyridoxal phosphate-dependent enzyme [Mycolicibacterium sp. P1-18]|uniref:YggS family pyridoxal phosphate-dependent enzyme n=1 Tax=Mycolicibacterium sp. P1-18 TaxID=2024615 RepID=UPI0011F29D0A|nr:YggS family pyridoxal phosphate-dependent enzyme [Mycolicibacterium sp. P1-18]KAA0092363.1 YggS family pyridoxal phosphate-dependent enzyme [Mycolicibacterium sp. P1-18]
MTSTRATELAESLAALRKRVDAAAAAAGRDVSEIELLPVTKFFPASDVVELVRLGCDAFGESREQEASAKIAELAEYVEQSGGPVLRWHMIGSIQRKKARAVAGWAYAAHSVDRAAVVEALGRGAAEALGEGTRADPLRVYVQVSLDGDPDRGGVDVGTPDLVDELCALADATDGLEFAGLMAIPPLHADAAASFVRLEAELHRVQAFYQQRLGLSAGMSGDLETAVKHGSTCVRVGTALMGPRPLTSP